MPSWPGLFAGLQMSHYSSQRLRVACVVGTRPEVIKMAPVIRRLRETNWAVPFVITTGQQDDLLAQALDSFHLHADHAVPFDPKGVNVAPVLASIVETLDAVFAAIDPVRIVAQGDTTSVLASAIAGFYRRIPFVHVEAGLRTGDLSAPFPEEYHRRMIAVSTALHCAPTGAAAQNLRNENIRDDQILISGNTVIDALLETAAERPAAPKDFPKAARVILLTAHRRESFGEPLREALLAIRAFIDATPDTAVFFPVHPNPAARAIAREILSNHERIVLAEPVSYSEIVGAMQRAWLVVTDSGGLQEEAPALGKPVLVLRDVTERPEAINAGAARIVGTTRLRIFKALTELLYDQSAYKKMAKPVFPYGDGHAAQRIVAALEAQVAPVADLSMQAAMHQHGGSKWMH
jgi:UDP-N-acetylglucosamine 2-epimerase (non-hydrolysing)